MEKKNIYQKLQEARCRLNGTHIEKSGKNSYVGFKYYELRDFMPTINAIFLDIGLIGLFDFGEEETAYLVLHDTENPESKIVFKCHKSEAGLRQGTPIQNTGALQNYIRRYLWVQCLEIAQDDEIDSLGLDSLVSKQDMAKKQTKPEQIKPPSLQELKDRLTGAKDLVTLSAYWANIPAKYKVQELINHKDLKKVELTPITDRIVNAKSMEEVREIFDGLSESQKEEHKELGINKVKLIGHPAITDEITLDEIKKKFDAQVVEESDDSDYEDVVAQGLDDLLISRIPK